MKCRFVQGPGVTAVVCGPRLPQRHTCDEPECHRDAGFQCDEAAGGLPPPLMGPPPTCDRWGCQLHMTKIGPNRHRCAACTRARDAARTPKLDALRP